MRIVVPIKQVPETKSVKMDEKTGTVIREGIESIVNPLDLYAIETAIQLREQHGGEVISISMGPAKAITALKEVIAMGIDSAVLVNDSAFAGSDTWATSYILAEAIKRIGDFSLVICGERATDGDTGQVGPGIAAFLDLPVITYVSRIEEIDGQNCRVKRLIEDGYENLSSSLPCVITVVKEISVPRLPTLKGKQRAKKTEIPVWGSDDLGIEPSEVGVKGSPTQVVKIFKPKIARECEKVPAKDEESVEKAVDRLTGFLRHKELI
jgi:electron transfer flavoprotein beta subunit